MKCSYCDHDNVEGDLFCEDCGTPLGEPSRQNALPLKPFVPPELRNTISFRIRGTDMPLTVKLGNTLMVGRSDDPSPEPLDVDLTPYAAKDNGVSRRHIRIEQKDGDLSIEDLESKNGTYLNGQRLSPHTPRILRYGDDLRLGHLVMRLTFNIGGEGDLAD